MPESLAESGLSVSQVALSSGALPTLHQLRLDIEKIEYSSYVVIDQFLDSLGVDIKCGHGRGDNSPNATDFGH